MFALQRCSTYYIYGYNCIKFAWTVTETTFLYAMICYDNFSLCFLHELARILFDEANMEYTENSDLTETDRITWGNSFH